MGEGAVIRAAMISEGRGLDSRLLPPVHPEQG